MELSTESLLMRSQRASLGEHGLQLKEQAVPGGTYTNGCFCQAENPPSRVIPYADILDAVRDESDDANITVSYARGQGSHIVPAIVVVTLDETAGDGVSRLLELSYSGTTPHRRVLVVLNPHGGQGIAGELFEKLARPILIAGGCKVEVVHTRHHGHAVELVQGLELGRFDVIACASGDGVPHEVFNGLYSRPDRVQALNAMAVTQLPCGSGNAMSESCHETGEASRAALSLLKAHVVNIDLMAVTQENKTTVSFLSQTVGLIAASDIGTEHLRFLGPVRFELGVAYGLLKGDRTPCEIAIKYAAKSKDSLREHYDREVGRLDDKHFDITEESLTPKYSAQGPVPDDWEALDSELAQNLSVFYTGKMPLISRNTNMFPAALPNDGAFDVIMLDARTSVLKQLPIFFSVDSGNHVRDPKVHHSKALAYRLTPLRKEGYLSIDGEHFPFKEFQVEVLPGAAKTLLKNGMFKPLNFNL